MIRLKVTASWQELQLEAFINDYQEAVYHQVELAARKFLLAAAPLIPEWTGFARGALQNLEERVGRISGNEVKKSKDMKPRSRITTAADRRGYYYKGVERTNLNSKQFGTPRDEIITMGRLTKATTRGRVVFYYSVDIDYFTVLDTKKWGAFAAGNAAFLTDVKDRLDKLTPKLGKYLTTKELKTT